MTGGDNGCKRRLLLLDNTLAVSLAILNSWLWNSRWTFRPQVTKQHRQRVLFVAQALLNVATNNLILLGMTSVIPASADLSALVASNLAKLAAMPGASSLSFLLLRTFVFHPPPLESTSSAPPN
jgi:putative flippase GtrA